MIINIEYHSADTETMFQGLLIQQVKVGRNRFKIDIVIIRSAFFIKFGGISPAVKEVARQAGRLTFTVLYGNHKVNRITVLMRFMRPEISSAGPACFAINKMYLRHFLIQFM